MPIMEAARADTATSKPRMSSRSSSASRHAVNSVMSLVSEATSRFTPYLYPNSASRDRQSSATHDRELTLGRSCSRPATWLSLVIDRLRSTRLRNLTEPCLRKACSAGRSSLFCATGLAFLMTKRCLRGRGDRTLVGDHCSTPELFCGRSFSLSFSASPILKHPSGLDLSVEKLFARPAEECWVGLLLLGRGGRPSLPSRCVRVTPAEVSVKVLLGLACVLPSRRKNGGSRASA